jgi:hypothetical protein
MLPYPLTCHRRPLRRRLPVWRPPDRWQPPRPPPWCETRVPGSVFEITEHWRPPRPPPWRPPWCARGSPTDRQGRPLTGLTVRQLPPLAETPQPASVTLPGGGKGLFRGGHNPTCAGGSPWRAASAPSPKGGEPSRARGKPYRRRGRAYRRRGRPYHRGGGLDPTRVGESNPRVGESGSPPCRGVGSPCRGVRACNRSPAAKPDRVVRSDRL